MVISKVKTTDMKAVHIDIYHIIITILCLNIFLSTGCCSKYNYYMYTDAAEKYLKEKKYDKAEKLISYAYNEEKKSKEPKFDRIAWLYYRLGVIAEQKNNFIHAKGYYWGDSLKEGFYSPEPKIAWLANLGWKHLDNNSTARSLDSILKYEEQDPPQKEVKKVQKKKIKRKEKKPAYAPKQRTNSSEVPERLFPPNPDENEIFAVWR